MTNELIGVVALTEEELAGVAGGSRYIAIDSRTDEPADSDRSGYLVGGH